MVIFPTLPRKQTVRDITNGISAPLGTHSSGRERLENLSKNIEGVTVGAGAKAVPGGRQFGAPSNVNTNSIIRLTSASGKSPSVDIIERETGIKNTINNQGEPVRPTTNDVLVRASRPLNTGIDSLKVEQAAAIINPTVTSNEQVVGPGQTKIASPTAVSGFSKAMGTAAALAKKEGIVAGVAVFTDSIDADSTKNDAVINKLPNGTYQLTNIGATVMNALRAPTSALGVRNIESIWEDANFVDNNQRLLNAENGTTIET